MARREQELIEMREMEADNEDNDSLVQEQEADILAFLSLEKPDNTFTTDNDG